MANDHRKQAYKCDHGKSLHQARRIGEKKFHSPCRSPGCDCRDYNPKKT